MPGKGNTLYFSSDQWNKYQGMQNSGHFIALLMATSMAADLLLFLFFTLHLLTRRSKKLVIFNSNWDQRTKIAGK